jgi:hypothetical protein
MKTWTKLDQYNYDLKSDSTFGVTEVIIYDLLPYDIVNITQGFNINDNRIYIDGHRLLYVDHKVDSINETTMRIMVHEMNLGV